MKPVRFHLGRVVATNGAIEVIERVGDVVDDILTRHMTGDWGSICEEDSEQNELAVKHNLRIMSVYQFGDDTLWVITEADRSATTILRPDEY